MQTLEPQEDLQVHQNTQQNELPQGVSPGGYLQVPQFLLLAFAAV